MNRELTMSEWPTYLALHEHREELESVRIEYAGKIEQAYYTPYNYGREFNADDFAKFMIRTEHFRWVMGRLGTVIMQLEMALGILPKAVVVKYE